MVIAYASIYWSGFVHNNAQTIGIDKIQTRRSEEEDVEMLLSSG